MSDILPAESNEPVAFGPFRVYGRSRQLFCGSEEVRLGGRATDVLLALARKKGEVVTKEELFAAAWPGIAVHESNLKVTVASVRRALREHSPGHEFIITVVGRGYWLGGDPRPETAADRAEAPAVAGSSLPELGTVIGRGAEIASLRERLASNRLTTVAGPGGIGKTTVAVAAAQLFEDDGVGSVTFVDLARVASGEFVASSLAAALGVRSDGEDMLQAIASILAPRKALMVFDTCEHVLNAVAHICDVLLAKTAHVRILATSRQVLRARGEEVLWLAPLEVPPPDHAGTAQDVLRYSAIQLIAARAFETSGYRLDDRDAPTIAEICRRLDGVPLAIELVSSRMAGRNAETVLEELDDGFRMLKRGSPGGPARQETLLLTLEWSYALLTRDEALVLRALAIFAGSFDTDSVVGVLAGHDLSPVAAFDAVAGLRAKSMISVDQTSGELRHRLLDSTRAFAGDLLASHGELAAVSANHAKLQLEILGRASAEHATMPAGKWHATYGGQADDLRKAIDWALVRGGDRPLGVQLVAAGLPLWHELSLADESRRNCERALAAYESIGCTDAPLKLKLVVGLATANTYLAAEPLSTIALFESAIQLARETADPGAECRALGALATCQALPGDQGAVTETLKMMRQAAVRTNDRSALWEYEQLCAVLDVHRCRFAAAHARLERLRAEMQDHAEGAVPSFQVHQRTNVEVQLGAICWLMGKPGRAADIIENTAREAMERGHGVTLIHCLSRGIIFVMCECHEYDKATSYTELLRRAVYRHGMPVWLPIVECYAATIEAHVGVRRSPRRLWAAFESLREAAARVAHHSYFATLANAMIAIEQVEDAARIIAYIFQTEPSRWRWVLPEFLRLRAATERAAGRDGAAEATLREALKVADEIGGVAWKLRSAHDLAVLLKDRGASADARQVLMPVYGQFSDGFNSGDLRSVGRLLEQLG